MIKSRRVVTVPGNRSYSSTTKYDKKIYGVTDSHIRRIKRNLFNNSLYEGKAQVNGFSGGNIKRLDLGRRSTRYCDHSYRIQCITHNTVDQIDAKDIVNRIINTGKKCLSYGVKEVIISSIFIKEQFKLTRIIRQVNALLRDECKRKNFQFIINDNVTREVL